MNYITHHLHCRKQKHLVWFNYQTVKTNGKWSLFFRFIFRASEEEDTKATLALMMWSLRLAVQQIPQCHGIRFKTLINTVSIYFTLVVVPSSAKTWPNWGANIYKCSHKLNLRTDLYWVTKRSSSLYPSDAGCRKIPFQYYSAHCHSIWLTLYFELKHHLRASQDEKHLLFFLLFFLLGLNIFFSFSIPSGKPTRGHVKRTQAVRTNANVLKKWPKPFELKQIYSERLSNEVPLKTESR